MRSDRARIDVGGKLVVDTVGGALNLYHSGSAVVSRVRGHVCYRLGRAERRFTLGGDISCGLVENRVSLSARDESVELTWQASVVDDGVEIRLQVTNVGPQPLTILELCPFVVSSQDGGTLDLGCSPETWSFYENGWQSWSPAMARRLGGETSAVPDDEYLIKHQPYRGCAVHDELVSHWFSIICDRQSRTSLLVGFTTAKDQLSEIRLRADAGGFRHLEAVCHTDGLSLSAGESVTSERLLVAASDDSLGLLELYARSLGEAMGALCQSSTASGWCSWYHFLGENTEEDVLANLQGARKHRLPIEVMLIDDGYQREIGDWLEVDEGKFPQGMHWLAQRISDAGYRPGLWVAPFAVSSQSRLYAEHPEWVLQDESDEPVLASHHWAIAVYALDVSNPDVQVWLREIFRILSDEWGYQWFKLDFVYAAALEGQRHNPRLTRAQALRTGLRIIREAVGDKFLLGCGCPLGPAVGLVDAMRVGPDVAPYWRHQQRDLSAPAAENALRNTVTRFFMHGALWINDPDCVLVRSKAQGSDLGLDEVRTIVTIVGMCGGLVISGDDLATIGASRLKYLKSILPPYGESAVPLDLFDRELPRTLALEVQAAHGRWLVAALINWEDHTVRTVIDLRQLGLQPERDYHIYDYWHRAYLGTARERVVIPRHRRHETAVLLFKPARQQPELLTSTFHLTQGGVEVRSVARRETGRGELQLSVTLGKQGFQSGQLLFSVPEPYVVKEARLEGRRRRLSQIAPGVVGMGFLLRDEARVEVAFSHTGLPG